MPNQTADQIITQGHKRIFRQPGGARPNNAVRYSGVSDQYLSLSGVGTPETGGTDPIYVSDPRRLKQNKLVGRSFTPADLASATLMVREKHGSIPFIFSKSCAFNLYIPTGRCKDLSDFVGGWEDYVEVYSYALVNDKDLGDRTPNWDTDDALEDSLSITLNDVYAIGSLGFGEQASTQVDREVIDIVYGGNVQCGDCGPADDGTSRIYAITKSSGAGSPGLPAELQYSVDGGLTWTDAAITGIGATTDPTAIDIVGNYVVVVVNSENAYYYATINAYTGVPGTFTKVTTGFVASKAPNDIYVAGPREVYFAGNGGYVYKTTDITSGVTVINAGAATTNNLFRIHGIEETIMAVGASSTTIRSINRGATFATTTAAVAGTPLDVTAVAVLDQLRAWVGTSISGRVYFTLNGGETWTEKSFSGSGSGSVRDIIFATDEVGYFSHDTNTPTARLFSTWDGGADWTNAAPRVLNLPTHNRTNRVAVPLYSDATTASNNVALAGLSGGGTDGVIYLGIASRL